jgi:hypothetical protein
MRSTRASAAWAGIALATSFLSVAILNAQPRTSSNDEIVASRDASLHAMKAVTVANDRELAAIEAARVEHVLTDRGAH